MGADSLPGNAPGNAGDYGPGPFIAAGHTPGVDQAQLAGASFHVGLMAGAVSQGRVTGSDADVPSPQHFPTRPNQAMAVGQSSVGDDTAAEQLPGRVRPMFDDSGAGGYG